MSSSPHLDDSSRPIPTRLLSSLKRPFSRPKNDHDRNPSSVRFLISLSTLSPNSTQPERTRGPIHGDAPPNYQQIAMGLHLSRTPHFPAHLAHLYPPAPQPRLHRSPSTPSSSTPPRTPPRTRASSLSLRPPSSHSHSRSHPHSPPRSPSRLLPPPARSALKKPRAKTAPTTSSSVTPDTASASTVASSVPPQTPTRSLARSGGLLALRERKAVRFGGLEEEDES
ncbi:hypothetical protein EDB87DRAFT_1635226 [Lactarius vividus]|nr:hypothetical protein EDB87DRAFT_1635226 [Lactarius vividus]